MKANLKVKIIIRHTKGRRHAIIGELIEVNNGVCHVRIGNDVVVHPISKVLDENGDKLKLEENNE